MDSYKGGFILKNINGECYAYFMSDSGALTKEAIVCP
jgi:hypothetical protein